MDKWLLMFFLGALLSLFLPIVPALFYIVLLLALVVALIIHKHYNISGLLLGCCWLLFNGYLYQHSFIANGLSKNSFHQQSHVIDGEVLTLASTKALKATIALSSTDESTNKNMEDNSNTQRFNVKIDSFDYKKLNTPFIVRLSWQQTDLIVKQGHKIRLKVKLKPAHGFANSGGFNYQLWLRAKNIVASGYVLKSKENHIVNSNTSLRQQQFEQIKPLLSQHQLSSLIMALALGERSAINAQQWQVLTATGTQHLIAISGLHLGLVASAIFVLILFLVKLAPLTLLTSKKMQSIIMHSNAKYIAIAMSLLLTLFYAALSGFAIPTIRALLMLSFYWLARLFSINLSVKRWLLLVVFFVLITAPMSILSASFWLSFYAVVVIFLLLWRCFLNENLSRNNSKIVTFIKSLLLLQLGLSLLLLPVTLFFYGKISLVAFFANIVAVPWMSFSAIPLSLAGVLTMPFSEHIARWLFEQALNSLVLLWQWLSFLAEQPWALFALSAQQILLITLSVISLAMIYFLKLKRCYYVFFTPLLLALSLTAFCFKSPRWQVTVLDVGHGLAVVIERNEHVILYDTGAKYPSGFNIADAVILPYLQQRGINNIDHVFISHNDNDHLGGLSVLQQKIAIGNVIFNESLAKKPHAKEQLINREHKLLTQQHCLQGQTLTWQGLRFEQLWPTTVVGDDNNDSCVIRISDGKYRILLTGDISKKVEKKLVKTALAANKNIQAEILIAPHHGSKSASSEVFLNAVKPQYAIFSSGYLNRWHMPVAQVLLNYHRNGIKTFTTAEVGMVQVNVSNKNIELLSYRDDFFPYWFAN
jgi:competence protein ComEC